MRINRSSCPRTIESGQGDSQERTLFGGSGVDDGADPGYYVGREAALLGVLADEVLAGGVVDAIDFVISDVAVDPLDLRAEVAEDTTGGLRDGFELLGGEIARVGDLPLDNVLGHGECLLKLDGPCLEYRKRGGGGNRFRHIFVVISYYARSKRTILLRFQLAELQPNAGRRIGKDGDCRRIGAKQAT